MSKSVDRDQQLDNRHYNLQSQIDHIRGFQSALADGMRGHARVIEKLQTCIPKDSDQCATQDCGRPGEVKIQGTLAVADIVGIPGEITLVISSFLCSRCWAAFMNVESAQMTAGEMTEPPHRQEANHAPWGTLWQK